MEVLFKIQLLVSKEVNKSSLLYEIIFSVKSDVLHLFLSVSEMFELFFLAYVSPHAGELLSFISGIDIIEHSELGTNEVGEVSDFDVSKIEANQELVMPDQTSEPFVVGPSSESGNSVDGSDVEEEGNDTPSASGERFVVGRYLLSTNSFEQGLHVVEVREDEGILLRVVGMHVSLLHVLDVGLIVALAVLSLVNGLLTIKIG